MAQSATEQQTLLKRKGNTHTPLQHIIKHMCTFTFQALFDQTPQQTSAVVTESGAHVIVDLEAVWHVDLKALLLELREQTGLITAKSDRRHREHNKWPVAPHGPAHLPHLALFCCSPSAGSLSQPIVSHK